MRYFAYGSNMAGPVMERACAEHRFIGAARLPDYRLLFARRSVRTGTGVADIVAEPYGEVWGALYELERDQLGLLDAKEGRGRWYEHHDVVVHTSDGAAHPAMAYAVITKEPEEICPSLAYVQGLIDGARERLLPAEYVTDLEAMIPRWGLDRF
jgi:gamma-glutamylcyclotransferase (GGCT)/AIG2-like uncharacterized protein YtfP